MLAAQAWAITVLLRRPDAAADRTLSGLGAVMTAGYLAERLVRQRLAPAGWDKAETPVVVAGISLSATMAVIGLRPSGPGQTGLATAATPLTDSQHTIRGMRVLAGTEQ